MGKMSEIPDERDALLFLGKDKPQVPLPQTSTSVLKQKMPKTHLEWLTPAREEMLKRRREKYPNWRRVVEDIPEWVGNKRLLSYYHKAQELDEEKGWNIHAKGFCLAFVTGGRASEIPMLRPEQFSWNDKVVHVSQMRVLKWRRPKTRTFLLLRDEKDPLLNDCIRYVKECKTDFLLPRHLTWTREPVQDQHFGGVRLWQLMHEIDEDLWCHWFRGQRASFLVYVRKYNVFELKAHFEWASVDTAAHYVRVKEEAERLGLKMEDVPLTRMRGQ